MMEDYEDQLSRVQLMASGNPQWDLSENDLAALGAVLARVAELESERESLLSLVRSSLKPHGLCQPRERKACTACNATDELRKRVEEWRGLRVHLMDGRAARAALGDEP